MKKKERGQTLDEGAFFECVEACHRYREWPCNGTCIDDDETCEGRSKPSIEKKCKWDQWQCGNGECISESLPCNGQCIGGRWPMYVRAQSQEGLFFSLKL